jgi:Rrf2 family protein
MFKELFSIFLSEAPIETASKDFAQMLALAQIVKSHRGVKGGFSLGRPANEITLREVVEICEGGIALNHCLRDVDPCKDADTCAVAKVWRKAQDALTEALDGTTLADVV